MKNTTIVVLFLMLLGSCKLSYVPCTDAASSDSVAIGYLDRYFRPCSKADSRFIRFDEYRCGGSLADLFRPYVRNIRKYDPYISVSRPDSIIDGVIELRHRKKPDHWFKAEYANGRFLWCESSWGKLGSERVDLVQVDGSRCTCAKISLLTRSRDVVRVGYRHVSILGTALDSDVILCGSTPK